MKKTNSKNKKNDFLGRQNVNSQGLLYTQTKHFEERQRERHISDEALAGIFSEVTVSYGGDARLIVPEKMMKKYRLRHLGTNIIIVLNSYRLITAFAISNLYEYLVFNNIYHKHYLL